MFFINGTKNFVKVMADNSFVDETTTNQLLEMVDHPSFTKPIIIMPDCHAGKGSVIGFTNKLGPSIIPNVVGVDIGCGMMTAKLKVDRLNFELSKLDNIIRKFIPSGMHSHKNEDVIKANPEFAYTLICETANRIGVSDEKVYKFFLSIGTLGGGNHFISVDTDSNDSEHLYLTVHSGSRNFGLTVAKFYQDLATKFCSDMGINVPKGSGYLPIGYSSNFENPVLGDAYLQDMKIAQEYATYNRLAIVRRILDKMDMVDGKCVEITNCIHNYIGKDNIIRKGAISATLSEKVIIPLNMRDGILLGVGKGNSKWNNSAPHGAGRLMSRNVAKKEIEMEDYRKTMEGIFTTSVNEDTLDEAPMAYKDSEIIKNAIGETVEITHHLKPIYNFKASK
jgi:tRNA-splicing ligase RtcB